MKATILFSKPTKVHDLRSSHASSPSSRKITPGPPVATDEASRASRRHDHDGDELQQTGVLPPLSTSVPAPRPIIKPPVLKPRLEPGKLKSVRHFFYDSSRSLAERMPSLWSILRDAAAKRTAPSPRRSSHVSASRRVFRDYGSGQYQRELDNVVSYRWVIMPRAPWKVRWDLWIGVIIFYSVVLIPYRIGFGIDVEYWEQVLDYLFDASFAVDVVFNFFTGFYDADIFIHELPEIRERYIKSWFLFDLVSTIPFGQFLQVVSSASSSLLTLKLLRTIRLFRLLKFMRLLRLKRAIETIQMDALNAHVLQTIKSLLMIIFIIHLASCGWYLFYTWDPTGVNWVTYFSEGGLKYPYLVSFYWVSNTMISVGYGDTYGVTDGERVYSILVECLGSICVGMIIANIQMLTENYNPRGIKLKQKLQETKEFLLKRNIPRRLRQRVISQFEYHWSNRTVFDEDQLLRQFPTLFHEPELFDALCHGLCSELILYLNNGVLSKIRFFDKKPKWFLTLILPQLVPQYFLAGDLLIYHGNPVSGIFFLMTGAVIVKAPQRTDPASELNGGSSEPSQGFSRAPDRDGTIAMLYEGEFFGYKEVLTQSLAQYNAFAVKPTGRACCHASSSRLSKPITHS